MISSLHALSLAIARLVRGFTHLTCDSRLFTQKIYICIFASATCLEYKHATIEALLKVHEKIIKAFDSLILRLSRK